MFIVIHYNVVIVILQEFVKPKLKLKEHIPTSSLKLCLSFSPQIFSPPNQKYACHHHVILTLVVKKKSLPHINEKNTPIFLVFRWENPVDLSTNINKNKMHHLEHLMHPICLISSVWE